MSTIDTGLEALVQRVLVDQTLPGWEKLRADISDLLTSAAEPEVFEQRLFALAIQAAVLDGVQLVRLARSSLPKNARRLRAAGKNVLRRLRLSMASWCYEGGYPRLAAMHLIRVALLRPTLFFRRRSIGILVRLFSRSNSRRNQLLQKEMENIFRLFNEHGVSACVFGSLAIALHAGKFVKNHGDIDLVFQNEADTDRAAALLIDKLDYRIVRRSEWIGLTGERCFHFILDAPRNMHTELSYLPENPRAKEHVVVVKGTPIRTVDLHDLRNIYALFLIKRASISHDLENQSKKNAILIIDRLLSGDRKSYGRSASV